MANNASVNKQRDFQNSYWDVPLDDLLIKLKTATEGLTTTEARERLQAFGPNKVTHERRFVALIEFLRFFINPLVIALLAAAFVSLAVGERINAIIIIAIVLLSVTLNFYQVFQSQSALKGLRARVALTCTVVRDGKERELSVADLAPGDVVKLNAGSLVPADARLLGQRELHLRESALTGESLPVEKRAEDLTGGPHGLTEASNSIFLGTSVQSGMAEAVVVRTGEATALGGIAKKLSEREPKTEFDKGIEGFGFLIIRVIILLTLFVFFVNVSFKRPVLQSFLFAIALAVGLTPELLPVILSVTLAQGAKRMAKSKVIVKRLESIENFGSMEILCSDKTGTLTLGEVVLQKHVNVEGKGDENVLRMAYLNSFFEGGVKDPLDDAILQYEELDVGEYTKIDEIPFDFERRRLSVVVEHDGERTLITKGAASNIFEVCGTVRRGEAVVPFDKKARETAESTFKTLSADGLRVLGVAVRPVPREADYDRSVERDMTLVGFAAFLDPPKEDVGRTIQALANDGITTLIMTGDNEYVTRKIAADVGLPTDRILVGSQVDAMDDQALAYNAERKAIFAGVAPEQKNRVITALRARGWVVGFMGDGINDAPSMHTADIAISVVNAVDVAKDAANIILLEKDLGVLHAGVVEGRSSFANIMKYIIMGTSSNFGNMFSMAAASLFLPFLPMLPTQILLNNLLYDMSQMSIPSDNVDQALLRRPKRWRIDFIRQFMVVIGPISSIYDFATFGVLLFVFHANESLFHTGWFVESLATQTLVVFVIRTAANPLTSRPSKQLTLTVLTVAAIGFLLPFTGPGRYFGFTPMPPWLTISIIMLALTYLALVQLVKSWFYRRHELI
ncbi:MAG: magnesium-translocating P-type ATPase [Actinomycetota bacterium]|nr:magnesium-translocating P-type ATPase [Actinomycetota bacterium]